MQVAYNVADNVPKLVICDAQRLQQVLLNVLNNAVKFTEKGEVLLEVWCEAQEERPQTQQEMTDHQAHLAEDTSDRQDRARGLQPLLGPVSKDSGQRVEVTGPELEAFRPFTPDNLSQHTEVAEMRQQVHGPAPSFTQHPGNVDALAASYNICRHDGNCSCPPDANGSHMLGESALLPGDGQQQRSGREQAKHQRASLQAASEQNDQLHHHHQNDTEPPTANFSDTFTAAPASKTSEGQQHILDTSSASAEAIEAHVAAKERSHSDSYRRQAMDGCQENMQARQRNSQASTSGTQCEEASHFTLNFSVRDSGIGISGENLKNLFQCFCQVRFINQLMYCQLPFAVLLLMHASFLGLYQLCNA